MRTLKRLFHTEGTVNWKAMLPAFLRSYRSTPHCTTGVPPATAFFNRNIKTKLPQINTSSTRGDSELKSMRQMDTENKDRMKTYADNRRRAVQNDLKVGDSVLVRQKRTNKFSTPYSAIPLTVTGRNQSMITAKNGQRKVTRNSSFFKKIHSSTALPSVQDPLFADDTDQPQYDVPQTDTGTPVRDPERGTTGPTMSTPRRSGRVIVAPKRLIEEM